MTKKQTNKKTKTKNPDFSVRKYNHPKGQAEVVLKEVVVGQGYIYMVCEEKGFRKSGLKERWYLVREICHQGFHCLHYHHELL